MGLHVGLTYNLKSDYPSNMQGNEDAVAEYESPETVANIVSALEELGHAVTALPYNPGLPTKLRLHQFDLVFNIAEGWLGRNRESLVPALLEFYGIPYTGSDPLTLGITLDKSLCKQLITAAGLATARGITVECAGDPRLAELTYPVFIKPNSEGSSKGIRNWSRIDDPPDLTERLNWLFQNYRQPILVEEFLPGREFTVAIIGNRAPLLLPIMEILPGEQCPGQGAFVYSFETKSGNLERCSCPATIDEHLESQIRGMARQAYQALQCRDLARIDIRLDAKGSPCFLEANPLPGLSPVSLLTLQAQAAGMTFVGLIDAICAAALERYPHLQIEGQAKEAALG